MKVCPHAPGTRVDADHMQAARLHTAIAMSLTAIGFLSVYVLGLALAFVRHPSFGLLSYVWAFYNLPPSRWWGSELPDVRWSLLAAAATAVALVLYLAANGDRSSTRIPWTRSWGTRLLLLFVAWMWLQTLWAVSPDRHVEGAMLYTKYAVLSYVLYNILTDGFTLERFEWVHVLGCFLWGWTGFMSDVSGRWEAVLGPGIDDSNVLGFHLVTGLAFAGFLFLTADGKKKWLAFLAIPFILNGIILTASRGTLLGLIAAGVAALVFAPTRRRAVVASALSLAMLLFFVLARNDALFWERAGSITQTDEQQMDPSAASRLTIAEANWRMAMDYPFGAGSQGTEVLSPQYVPEEYLTDGRRSAHNTWMAVLVDEGIPGLILFVSLYLWVIVRLFKLRALESSGLPLSVAGCRAAVAVCIAAFLVSGQFMNLFKAEVLLWLIAIVPVLDTLLAGASAAAPAVPPQAITALAALP